MAEVSPPVDLSQCCLVAAHPDDEVLWFSSILDRVGRVVLCFEDCEDYPALGPGRRAVLAAYPRPGVSSLRLPEPGSVHLVDWTHPEWGEHGLYLNGSQATDARRERYRQSFHALRAALATQLRGTALVFSHNPWGEYGHPDHIQLARVLESLRPELGFRLFHSGYIAHRTMPLGAQVLPRLGRWFELPTQPALAEPIAALYRQAHCWTWPVDHQRFATETFLEASDDPPIAGSGFRLNCVTA